MSWLRRIGHSNGYWLLMIFGGLAMEAVALYYQYALNQYPCVLCIHVRIWVLAFVVLGVLGLLLKHSKPGLIAVSLLSVVSAIGLAERSWQTLAAERGWTVELACSMESGLPSWFALDVWFPALFQVQASCGYSPVIALGVTMAESLVLISALAVAVTAGIFAAVTFSSD